MGMDDDDARSTSMKLTCSHGGRLVPSYGPDGEDVLRFVAGGTRVLAVPRTASFRDLAARLSSEVVLVAGAEVRSVMHRLADDEDVVVSVTCDEYDRLRAMRPNAAFRVFVVSTAPACAGAGGGVAPQQRGASGFSPVDQPPMMRRVQSDPALAVSAQQRLLHHRRPASYPAVPLRCIRRARELVARASHNTQPSVHHQGNQGRFVCQRQDVCAPVPPPTCALPFPYMSSRGNVVNTTSVAAEAKERSRDAKSTVDIENRSAIWDFE